MDSAHCTRCGSERDTTDNFCRSCGHQLTIDVLPARRPAPAVPAPRPVTVSIPPSVVRGVAVLALGTGVEWMLRRVAGNAVKVAGRSLLPGASASSAKQLQQAPRDLTINEILYVRKVQLRR